MRTNVPASLLFAFFLFVLPVAASLAQGDVTKTQLSGRWTSTERVTFTNPSRAGSSFFLDIVIAEDGTFQGVWDAYTCMSYPGAYSTMIISCSRVKKPAKVRGKFNLATGSGEIELEQLGRSSFRYTLGPKLNLELPKNWLKQGDPVLFTSQLERKPKQGADAQPPGHAGSAITLRELFKGIKHPTKNYYAVIDANGLKVSFKNMYGNFTGYTFLPEAFPLNVPCALLSPGSRDLLPLLATRVGTDEYRIEWLEAPPSAGFQKIVKGD